MARTTKPAADHNRATVARLWEEKSALKPRVQAAKHTLLFAGEARTPERRKALTLLERRARLEGMIQAREDLQQTLDVAADRERQLRQNHQTLLRQHMELRREMQVFSATRPVGPESLPPAPSPADDAEQG
ncbi:hypothetical protein [Deinococcus aerophilus]|uniref:Uncharacterized protein n=1 Tax=Deinococcus aerophilus TaxID=522488 RepID=A0ABQ2GMM0_9DEIO|nr:hypothetical protein [Deinococcus aerophilus]GGM02575.1 hypothetical protein GCM10010841_08880 [Deinococcus aerophilus]